MSIASVSMKYMEFVLDLRKVCNLVGGNVVSCYSKTFEEFISAYKQQVYVAMYLFCLCNSVT